MRRKHLNLLFIIEHSSVSYHNNTKRSAISDIDLHIIETMILFRIQKVQTANRISKFLFSHSSPVPRTTTFSSYPSSFTMVQENYFSTTKDEINTPLHVEVSKVKAENEGK